jgi:hypothetical protein
LFATLPFSAGNFFELGELGIDRATIGPKVQLYNLSSKFPKPEKVELSKIGVCVGGLSLYPLWVRRVSETILDGKNGLFWGGLRPRFPDNFGVELFGHLARNQKREWTIAWLCTDAC